MGFGALVAQDYGPERRQSEGFPRRVKTGAAGRTHPRRALTRREWQQQDAGKTTAWPEGLAGAQGAIIPGGDTEAESCEARDQDQGTSCGTVTVRELEETETRL